MKKVFPAELDELNNVLMFAEEELDKAGCTMKAQTSVAVALEEMFVNVAHYAYPDQRGTVEIEILTNPEKKEVIIRLTDSGIPFDPLKKADPDTTLSLKERKIGGLGIFMVKKMMDDVSYSYTDNNNIFTMVKYF